MPISLVDLRKVEVNEVGWRSSDDWTSHAEHLTGHNLCNHASPVIIRRNRVRLELLVLRLAKLVFRFQVDPQLEAERVLLKAARHLCVHDALARGHPLDVAFADDARISFEVFVVHFPRQHVSNRLEAPVRVVWEPSWKAHIEQVQHQEWIQVVDLTTADDSANFGIFAFALLSRLKRNTDSLELIDGRRRRCFSHFNELL